MHVLLLVFRPARTEVVALVVQAADPMVVNFLIVPAFMKSRCILSVRLFLLEPTIRCAPTPWQKPAFHLKRTSDS